MHDTPFHVPYVLRLRFTHDVLGADTHVLLDLLEPSGHGPPRVQFWVDEHLTLANPQLEPRLEALCQRHADRFVCASALHVVAGGETIKNDIHLLERILKAMHAADLDRRSYVVVLGGGAVLDAIGFAAAIAHRGIRLIRLPTTTLSQADSGIGVKNSVNLFQKKNWLGTFAVPWGVVNDAALLRTLTDRDFRCGFAEAVKVALLKDPALFAELEQSADALGRRDMAVAGRVIRRSAELHMDHITRGGDPFEAAEARPLDFGHWSAHRLEALSDFALRHGEAVAIGVAVDTVYAARVLGLPRRDALRVLVCLRRLGFRLYDPALDDANSLLRGLEEFRQHLGGRLTLTMLAGIGGPIDVHEVDTAHMCAAIGAVAAFAQGTDQDLWA
ncbi:MAG: 3-dehydroquinate synthase [Pirellulaceae bacterium]|nr:3-dehydroquinate synthase [Pirellulaceae bacterium]